MVSLNCLTMGRFLRDSINRKAFVRRWLDVRFEWLCLDIIWDKPSELRFQADVSGPSLRMG